MNNLNQYVLDKASLYNVCQPGALKISAAKTTAEMLQIYIDGIDFCLSNNFPTNQDLREIAGDIMNQHGIYIDQRFKICDRRLIVALGICIGEIRVTNYNVCKVYAKHDSVLKIIATNNSFIDVDCLDTTNIEIIAQDNATVLVSVYSNAIVSQDQRDNSKIKVQYKLKETY
jgi:hypothetical protein